MSFSLESMNISGKEVLPLIEGGKGVAVSNGETTGAWAAAGGVGTFSAVNADSIDENGNIVRTVYHAKAESPAFRNWSLRVLPVALPKPKLHTKFPEAMDAFI